MWLGSVGGYMSAVGTRACEAVSVDNNEEGLSIIGLATVLCVMSHERDGDTIHLWFLCLKYELKHISHCIKR